MKKSVKASYNKGIDYDLYKSVARYLCAEDEDLQRIGINMYYNSPLVNKYHENYFDFSPREGLLTQRFVTIARINTDIRRRNLDLIVETVYPTFATRDERTRYKAI